MSQKPVRGDRQQSIIREVRSPGSAAPAGIVFSLLLMASMVLLYKSVGADLADVGPEWLERWSSAASVVLVLVPFAGIAFLWFTGVMRDLIGALEDKFFSTVFLGSGIILVVMMFVWAAAVGAVLGTYALTADVPVGRDVYVYGLVFMDQIIGSYFLRMAAVYMLSIGSLWMRTRVVPRWLILGTYVVGLGFLLFAGGLRETRFLFPGWVLLVSVYILTINYRRRKGLGGEDRQPVAP